jgi:hypothetical protein
MTTLLIMVAIPLAVLFIARCYAAAHSNTSQTVAEALVRWLCILAWFTSACAEGAVKTLMHYRERRWSNVEQPICERYRPWEEVEQPQQIEPSLVAQLERWDG